MTIIVGVGALSGDYELGNRCEQSYLKRSKTHHDIVTSLPPVDRDQFHGSRTSGQPSISRFSELSISLS